MELFIVDALVLRHDCFKIYGDTHILSEAKMYPTVCGFWRYKAYADTLHGEVVSNASAVV